MAPCPHEVLATSAGMCTKTSQVGIVGINGLTTTSAQENENSHWKRWRTLHLIPSPPGHPAALGFNFAGIVVVLLAELRDDGDYGIDLVSPEISEALPISTIDVRIWGVPADASHDSQRGLPGGSDGGCLNLTPAAEEPVFVEGCSTSAGLPPTPFLRFPTSCSPSGVGLESSVFVRSWAGSVDRSSFFSHMPAPAFDQQVGTTGCDRLAFEPRLGFEPTNAEPDAPTGADAWIEIPQNFSSETGIDPYAPAPVEIARLSQADLKRASVTLPEGLTISPTGAHGLEACADSDLRLGSKGLPSCPAGSKIGSVEVDSPLLDRMVHGSVHVRTQNSTDPQSGEMFRLAVLLRDDALGINIKLPGSVKADPQTGRLEAVFDDNPQLPFSSMRLHFKGGSRAPLATPASCGGKSVTTSFDSWGGQVASPGASFGVACQGGLGGFDPSFEAGSLSGTAGTFSPFALTISKPDGDTAVKGVELDLPEGLAASLRGNVGERVGSVTAFGGPGPDPFPLPGSVYLEGPYGDAPFSLRAVVPANAGPFDLGDVVVRQKIYVDPDDASVRVVSDPLPTIVKGVPARLQRLDVDIDKDRFTLNPTSCAQKRIAATLVGDDGSQAKRSSPFAANDCSALGFRPRVAMRLAGKRQTKTGGHPSLRAVVKQAQGQANIGSARVTLPKSIALDAVNSYDPKLVCDYDKSLKADCPASTVIGKATASTPVLNRPLSGKVHLVQGIKFGARGNRIRTTPTLLVKLRGEVAIDLRAKTTVKRDRLVTTFPQVPDAPVSKFSMRIDGGKKGILVVTRTRRAKIDLCAAKQTAKVDLDAHNGKHADFATRVKTPCAKGGKSDGKHRRGR